MAQTRAEISKRYDTSEKGREWRKQWVETNKEHLAKYHAEWVKKNLKKTASSVSRWRKENPEKYSAQVRRYYRANKEKIAAQKRVKEAIKQGILHRPEICEHCGSKARIDGHHHKGYDHPLEVLWLCRQCHSDQHPRKLDPTRRYGRQAADKE
jgi:rubrerythrin